MRSVLIAALPAVLLLPGLAAAQDMPDRDGWGVALTDENDVFDFAGENTDRYFTQGFKASYLPPESVTPRFLDVLTYGDFLLKERPDHRVRSTIGIGQHIYTPENLSLTQPDPRDRPYAGWAYVSLGGITYSNDRFEAVELQFGLVGPSARAGDAQNAFHDLIGAARSQGWDHQLHDEVAINLYLEQRWEAYHGNIGVLEYDLTRTLTGAVGTVEVSGGFGGTARLGFNLDGDFGPPRLRPAVAASEFFSTGQSGAYLFATVHGRAIARDIFLDGNTFLDSASVARRAFVPEATVGAALRLGNVRLAYSYNWRGEEFLGQNGPLEYGAISLTITTRGLSR